MKFNSLNESGEIKRALYGDYKHKIKTFAIMSPENPMGVASSPMDNNKSVSDFKSICRTMNIQILPINGMFNVGERNKFSNIKYGDNKYGKHKAIRYEHSFILINCTLEEAKGLAETFRQMSFFLGINFWGTKVKSAENVTDDITTEHTASELRYYDRLKEDDDFRLAETSRKILNAKDFDNFFSKHKDFKYSIYLKLFNECYDEIYDVLDDRCLVEALSENRTSWRRSTCRYYAYNGTLL